MNNEEYNQAIQNEEKRWREAHGGDAEKYDTGYYNNPLLKRIVNNQKLKPFFDLISKHKFNDALELGCGNGLMAADFHKYGLNKITGIDLSYALMEPGAQKASQESLPILFVAGDLNKMDLGENKYDIVYSHDSLHHIMEIEDLMQRIKRCLRPGGYFVVLENDEDSELNRDIADVFLSKLDPKYSRSLEDIKPDHLKNGGAFEGVSRKVKQYIEPVFKIISYDEFGAFAPWMFRFQYNWAQEDEEMIKRIVKIDRSLILSGVLKGNIKIIISQKV